jgi:muconolactone delta-isomerase
VQFMVLTQRRTEKYDAADFDTVIPAETDRARALYAEGVVRHAWHRGDVAGACLILEVADAVAAQSIVNSLPLAVSGMADFTVVPLQPYRGFGIASPHST